MEAEVVQLPLEDENLPVRKNFARIGSKRSSGRATTTRPSSQ